MEQSVQLLNAVSLPAFEQKMYFIHRPTVGWQLTARLDPNITIVGIDQLTPPTRNDYLTYYRMMLSTETLHGPEIVKEEILKIRDEHIRLIEAIRNDRRLPYHRREKVPRLDELDGAKINVIKYLHWTPIQISWYEDLCRHEWLAVLGVAHRLRTGEDERERYMKDLARVFPGQWGLVTDRLEGSPVAVKQDYLPKRLLELPMQIRKPKSPQASSRSPTSTISRTAPT